MGGDHSVTIPTARALDMYSDLCVVQFDAHLDFGKRRWTNGSPMRMISEMSHFTQMCQIGMRGLGSNTREDFNQPMIMVLLLSLPEKPCLLEPKKSSK